MSRRLLVRAALILLLTSASGAQTPPAMTARVIDEASHAALTRVRVALMTRDDRVEAVFTDDRGSFTLAGVSAESAIRFSKAGYATVRLSAPEVPAIVRLSRAVSISGRAVDPAGAPFADAQVRLRAVLPVPGQPGARMVETDDLGEYRFGGLAAGRYEVTVVRPWQSSPRTVNSIAGDDIASVDFTVPPFSCQPDPLDRRAQLPGANASITGRITTAAGPPLACAEVRALRVGDTPHITSADANGRFTLSRLTAGVYRVEARAPGYAAREYGQRSAGQSGTPLTVGERNSVSSIDISLSRGSAILGTVVDEHGEPLESVTMQALQLRSVDGRTVAVTLRSTSTDDRGQYRLAGLLRGRYLVAASDDAVLSGRMGATGYAPIFYPGEAEAVLATPISLDGQHDQTAAGLVYRPVRAVQVTGSALGSTGVPPSAVLLMSSQRSGGIQLQPRSGEIRADGTFSIANVPPGEYVLQTVSRPQAAAPEFGMQYLTVGDAPPAPIAITMRPMSTVRGRIIVEGPGATAGDFFFAPVPTDFDRTFAIGAGFPWSIGSDGSFTMGQVTGPRRLTMMSGPRGWYLKSATLDGVDVTDAPFDFGLEGHAYDDLEIVVSSQGAEIAGNVRDGNGRRVRDYAVVVYTSDRSLWFRSSRHVRFTRADQNGRFAIDGLAPGSYLAVALAEMEGNGASGEWQDPMFLEALSSNARRVELHEGERVSATLALSSR